MNFQKLLAELDDCTDECADERVAHIANTVSEWAVTNGYPDLVRDKYLAADRFGVRRYIAVVIAATKSPGDLAMTPPQVAKKLGVRPSRVLTWIKAGQLKASNLATGNRPRYRVMAEDLEAFLRSREPQPKPPKTRRSRPSRF